MILSSLLIYQSRNITRIEWNPHPKANLLLGSNAQGKTNLLEAIFFLGTTKTLRPGTGPDDLIQHHCDEALLRAKVSHQEGIITRDLEAQLKRGQPKRFLLNFKKLTAQPVPEELAKFPVFALDRQGWCLTGPAYDTVMHIDEVREKMAESQRMRREIERQIRNSTTSHEIES